MLWLRKVWVFLGGGALDYTAFTDNLEVRQMAEAKARVRKCSLHLHVSLRRSRAELLLGPPVRQRPRIAKRRMKSLCSLAYCSAGAQRPASGKRYLLDGFKH